MNDNSDIEGRRIAAIDYGKRRVGIAISDILHITTRPYDTFLNDDSLLEKLKKLAYKENIGKWIVGVPIGSVGENSIVSEIQDFIKKLKETTKLDTIEVDESFSSIKGGQDMLQSGMRKKKRAEKGMLDRFAANSILRDYLDRC